MRVRYRGGGKASQVTVDPTGLSKVTGITSQEAVAQLDAAVTDADVIELAYGENNTGLTQVLTNAAADLTGCVVTVPEVTRPVWLMGKFTFDVTTAPAASNSGTVIGVIEDELNNVIDVSTLTIEGGAGTSGYITLVVWGRIAPNTPQRQYRLMAQKGANATMAGAVLNGSVPGYASRLAAFRF